MVQLKDKESKFLAEKIKTNIFNKSNDYKTSIFLCGADINNSSTARFKVAQLFEDWWSKYFFRIYYPEDIFDELLYSSESKDLLSLENLLAKSVDVIIMIPESPGSFAELGAFANDENLRKKMICILDIKYKKNKSFINQGPVKLVKNVDSKNVLFLDLKNLQNHKTQIHIAVRNLIKSSNRKQKEVNLLQADSFILPILYLLEPTDKKTITNILKYAMNEDEENAFQATFSALTTLTKKNYVEVTSQGYKLTTLGKNEFLKFKNPFARVKFVEEGKILDDLRLDLLNLIYKNKRLKV